ncbi:DUF4241 domain-containing protein [Kitasatospora gansuensis]
MSQPRPAVKSGGHTILRHLAEWRYEQQDLPDRSDEAWKRTVDLYPDGKNSQGLYPRGRLGGSTRTLVDLPRDLWWLPGFRFTHRDRSEPVTIEPVRTVTEIALPAGQLAVCDPSYLPDGTEGDPLVIGVPPGVYPVQETGAGYENEMFGDRFTARDTYAVRLPVSEKPTGWTMAIPPGKDVRLLRDGQYVGFGDSTARTELGRRYMRAWSPSR